MFWVHFYVKSFSLGLQSPWAERERERGREGGDRLERKESPFQFNLINVSLTVCFWPNLQVKPLGLAKLFLVNIKEMTNLYLATSGRWFRFICLYSVWIWILSPISSITASIEPRTQTSELKQLFSAGVILTRGDRETFVCQLWEEGYHHTQWIEASDAAEYLPIPGTGPHNKKLFSVKWQ